MDGQIKGFLLALTTTGGSQEDLEFVVHDDLRTAFDAHQASERSERHRAVQHWIAAVAPSGSLPSGWPSDLPAELHALLLRTGSEEG
ncbi:MAG: hypothetical protein AAGF12_25915 [Myxococcota bacterium]